MTKEEFKKIIDEFGLSNAIAVGLVTVSLIICLIVGVINYVQKPITTYKSITPIEQVQFQNLSIREGLDLLIQQDKDLTELINKKHNKNIDMAFEIFYKNLLSFVGKETEFESKLNDGYGTEKVNKGIVFKSIEKEKVYHGYTYTVTIKEIVTPKTDIIKMLNDGEGGYSAGINYNYLVNKYSKSLTKPWQEFLSLKNQEYIDHRCGYTYYLDGYPPSQDVLANWIIAIEKFISKYPNFTLNSILQDNKEVYYSSIMRTDVFDENDEIRDFVKIGAEKILSDADKTTNGYKEVEKWYNDIKKTETEKLQNKLPTLKYDINSKKWFQIDKRKSSLKAGNYVYIVQGDIDDNIPVNQKIFGKKLDYMFNENEIENLRNEDFLFGMDKWLTIQNGRLFHYNYEVLKLFEVIYDDQMGKIKLIQVSDHKVIEDYYKGKKVIYTSKFKQTEDNIMSTEIESTYPIEFKIYNDLKEPWLDFYTYYFSGNDNDFEHTMDGIIVKCPTTLHYRSKFEKEKWDHFEIKFK